MARAPTLEGEAVGGGVGRTDGSADGDTDTDSDGAALDGESVGDALRSLVGGGVEQLIKKGKSS